MWYLFYFLASCTDHAKTGLFSESKIQIDERLTEAQIGDLEGKPKLPVWKPEYIELYHTESNEEIRNRINSFYTDLMKDLPSGDVLVITHNMPAQALFSQHPLQIKSSALERRALQKIDRIA